MLQPVVVTAATRFRKTTRLTKLGSNALIKHKGIPVDTAIL
jgi:hypothetical protein